MESVRMNAQQLGRLLECSVCMEEFSDQRVPKALPCQHTMCLVCVTRLAADTSGITVVCPQCRATHRVPMEGPQKFPNNLVIMELMSVEVMKSCQVAGCDQEGAFRPCFHCNEKICPQHLQQHTKQVQGKVQQTLVELKQYVQQYRTVIAEVQKLSASCEKSGYQTKANIISHFDDLISQLQRRKTVFLGEFNQNISGVLEYYTKQETRLRQNTACINNYCSSLTDVYAADTLTTASKVEELISQSEQNMNKAIEDVDIFKTQQVEFSFNRMMPSCFNDKDQFGSIITKKDEIVFRIKQVQGEEINPHVMMTKEVYTQKGACLKDLQQIEVGRRQVKWQPRGVTVCSTTGDVIVTSDSEPCVHVLDSQLNHLLLFGCKGSKPKEFNSPRGVVVDIEENIIICDSLNKRLQVLQKSGELVRVVTWQGEMHQPHDISLDDLGCMYVSDWEKHHILVFDGMGQPLQKLVTPVIYSDQESALYSIAVNGSVIALSMWAECLHIVDIDGKALHCITGGEGDMGWPNGVCVDNSGHIVVVDDKDACVKVYSKEGQYVCQFKMEGKEKNQLVPNCWLAIGSNGHLLVTNTITNSLQVY